MAKTVREFLLLVFENYRPRYSAFRLALSEFQKCVLICESVRMMTVNFNRSIDAIRVKCEELEKRNFFKRLVFHASEKAALDDCSKSLQKAISKFQVSS